MTVSVEQALAHLRQAEQARKRAGRARAERLRHQLGAAAELLRQRYGVQRVVVFGSLVTGNVTPESDVDLATEGLNPARYFEALADLMFLFGSPVDLVRLEEAPTSLRERVRDEGMAL